MASRKKDIEYGDVEVSDEELTPAAVRRRISIMIPENVLRALRAMATARSTKYQTLINDILAEKVSGQRSLESRIEALEVRALVERGYTVSNARVTHKSPPRRAHKAR